MRGLDPSALAGLLAGRATAASYASAWRLVRALPEPVAARAFDAAADVALRRGGRGVDRLRANLARVAPDADLDALVRDAMRSYARYWREVFRLPSLSPERLLRDTVTTGEEGFRAAVSSGRGAIVALPHSGNWDAAGAWCTAGGVPFTTVAERLRPEALYERFLAFRESLGFEVLPLTGGARPPFDVLVERLEQGRLLCLMGDRDLSARGVDVELFGATARVPAGPASLALRTGAVLVPASTSFTDTGWRIDFHAEVPHTDVATMCQQVADRFAEGIAARPQDWHMLQRVWLDDLAPDDPRRAPSRPAA